MEKMKMNVSRAAGRRRRLDSDSVFNGVLVTLVIVFLVILLYPLIYVLSCSFSSGPAVTGGRVVLWPVDLSLDGYRSVFANRFVWTGYANTIFYAIVGTGLNLVLTVLMAYPLSRRGLPLKKLYTTLFILVPMFFGGGLIPTYMLFTSLHLVNTRWAILLSGAVSATNVVIMRTFFTNSIPMELLESAQIDGITDVGYLFKMVLPLSKAVLSVITLYYMVGHWNAYFTPMIYLHKRETLPLQIVLRQILSATRVDTSEITDPEIVTKLTTLADVMKYSLIVISTIPMLILYPFVQKFFEKGVMIGSLKG